MFETARRYRGGAYFVVCWFVCLTNIATNELLASYSRPTDENVEIELESQPDDDAGESRPAKNITAFNINTIESLADVQDFLENDEYDLAAKKLEEMWLREADFTASEKAEIKYMFAHIAHLQGKLELLVDSLESVLEFRENISYAREQKILLQLSKLYFSQKKYEKAHERLRAWLMLSDQPLAQDLVYAGKLFAQVRDFTKAEQFLQRAITLQHEAGKEVDTTWSELLQFVQNRRDARK